MIEQIYTFIDIKSYKNVNVYYIVNDGYKNFRSLYLEDLDAILKNGNKIIGSVYTDDIYIIIYKGVEWRW